MFNKRTLFMMMLVVLCISASVAAVEILPLEQVQPGMVGIGKTVVRGTKIEEFRVEVIDVIPQQPPTPSLIMVRVSGDVIERSGGIAAGMSGSPVYINDKLLGAIGYGYSLTDHRIGLVTPAESMLAILTDVSEVPRQDEAPSPEGEMKENREETEYTEDFSEIVDPVFPEDITPLATPLLVGGINGRALNRLKEAFDGYPIKIIPGMVGTQSLDFKALEPGSAFGVQLLRGDFQVTSFGTVTYVEDGKFVGFGHPFLHKGKVDYFVTPAVVHFTMPSLDFPFKVASAGQTIGALLQDRAAGVAGSLNVTPAYVPVTIMVEDEERGIQEEYYVEMVNDEDFLSSLAVSSVYQAVDATLDRIGKGTAYVRLELSTDKFPWKIVKENMFHSDSDIAVWSVHDLDEGLRLLVNNHLEPVRITDVSVYIKVLENRMTATIEKAVPRSSKVVAGGSVDVEVAIRPYRDKVEYRILRIDIPADTMPGLLTVTVRGGGSSYYVTKPTVHTSLEDLEAVDEEYSRRETTGGESLEKLMEDFVGRERNNEIVAEYYPFVNSFVTEKALEPEETDSDEESITGELPEEMPIAAAKEGSKEEEEGDFSSWDESADQSIRVRLTTQYVIDGLATFDLEVVEPSSHDQ